MTDKILRIKTKSQVGKVKPDCMPMYAANNNLHLQLEFHPASKHIVLPNDNDIRKQTIVKILLKNRGINVHRPSLLLLLQ